MSDNPYLDAAMAYYLQSQNNKAPKSYILPNTPEQDWQFGQTKDLSGFAQNYMKGLIGGFNPNPTGLQFTSQAMKGQPFAGGMQLPNFSGGANGGLATGTPSTSKPTGSVAGQPITPMGDAPFGVGGGRPVGEPFNRSMNDAGDGTPRDGETIADYLGRNPGGDPRAFLPNGGQAPDRPTWTSDPNSPNTFQQISSWWTQYYHDHPNVPWDVARAAATAFFGPMGGAAVAIGQRLFGHKTTPTGTQAGPSGTGFNPGATP